MTESWTRTYKELQQHLRIKRAPTAYQAYRAQAIWGNEEELIADLLADLMHYVDWLRVDREIDPLVKFDELLDTARNNYNAEVEENKE